MGINPKPALLNPLLTRPNWESSIPRSTQYMWLDKNENLDAELLALSTSILRMVPSETVATYPEFGPLYRKLAAWVGVDPDALLLTPGSDGVIRMAFEAFVREGDVVLHTKPTFAMYPVYCQMFGATAVALEYRRGSNGPELFLDEIKNKIRSARPRLFCLPNPDSPTGTMVSPPELNEIVECCAETNTLILVDEAYHPFYDKSCVNWTEVYPNLIVARTFAKAWGLAGLRIGYAVANPSTLAFLHKMRPMYEVNTVAAVVVEKMLDHVEAMEASVKRLNEGKQFFLNEMKRLGFNVFSGYGNFLHVAFGEEADLVHATLADKVLYRQDFREVCLKGFSRFSSTTKERFKLLVDVIENIKT